MRRTWHRAGFNLNVGEACYVNSDGCGPEASVIMQVIVYQDPARESTAEIPNSNQPSMIASLNFDLAPRAWKAGFKNNLSGHKRRSSPACVGLMSFQTADSDPEKIRYPTNLFEIIKYMQVLPCLSRLRTL